MYIYIYIDIYSYTLLSLLLFCLFNKSDKMSKFVQVEYYCDRIK